MGSHLLGFSAGTELAAYPFEFTGFDFFVTANFGNYRKWDENACNRAQGVLG